MATKQTTVEVRPAEPAAQAQQGLQAAMCIQHAFKRFAARQEFNSRVVSTLRVENAVRASRRRNRGVGLLVFHLLFMTVLFVLQAIVAQIPNVFDAQSANEARVLAVSDPLAVDEISTVDEAYEWIQAAMDALQDDGVAEKSSTAAEVREELELMCSMPGIVPANICDPSHALFKAIRLRHQLGLLSECTLVYNIEFEESVLQASPCSHTVSEVCTCDPLDCGPEVDDLCSMLPENFVDLCSAYWVGEEDYSDLVADAATELAAAGQCTQCSGSQEAAWLNPANLFVGFATVAHSRYVMDSDTFVYSSDLDASAAVGVVSGRVYPTASSADLPHVMPLDVGVFGYTDMNECWLGMYEADEWLPLNLATLEFSIRAVDPTLDLYSRTTVTFEVNHGGGFEADVTCHALLVSDAFDAVGAMVLLALLALGVFCMAVEQLLRLRALGWRKFFGDPWTLLHLSGLGVYTTLIVLWLVFRSTRNSYSPVEIDTMGTDQVATLLQDNEKVDSFIDEDAALRSVVSVAVLVAILQAIERCKFHYRVSLVTRTLAAAKSDLINFMVFFALVWVSFSFMAFNMLGHSMAEFASMYSASETLLFLALGEIESFNYGTVIKVAPILGPIMTWLYTLVVMILLLNVLLSIVVDSFSRTSKSVDTSEPFSHSLRLALAHYGGWARRVVLARVLRRGPRGAIVDVEEAALEAESAISEDARLLRDIVHNAPGKPAQVTLTRGMRQALRDFGLSPVTIGRLTQTAQSRLPTAAAAADDPQQQLLRRVDQLTSEVRRLRRPGE